MPSDLSIFDALTRHGVPFVIVGGHAVNFHGFQRLTEDADAVWIRSQQAEAALFAALSEIGACYIGRDIDPATGLERLYPVTLGYIRANRLMMLWTDFGFLDLFDYIPGCPDEDPRQLLQTAGNARNFRFASREWLIRMKKAAGRHKDLNDLENLPD